MSDLHAHLPESYREPEIKSCSNCCHAYEYSDYSDPARYYCTYNAPPRPPSGDADERFDDVEGKDRGEAAEEWWEWEYGRFASRRGVCDHYEPEEEAEYE